MKISKMKILVAVIVFFIAPVTIFAQQASETLIESFEVYSKFPREVAYVHLNKSVYVEGETLGFSAYIFDKITKERSLMTSNLYCYITDEEGQVIKEKLVLVENGVASNIFSIDSLFTKSTYTFKAFTNYMLNFDEQNHFEQKFSIVYADKDSGVQRMVDSDTIDLQVLPEGGHFISDVFNTIAVIAKNNNGEGVANADISILNQKNELISEFKLNEFGIGKTIIKPFIDDTYRVIMVSNTTVQQINVTDIKPTGISLSLNELQDKVILKFSTNPNGLKSLAHRNFTLAVHNGGVIKTVPLSFNNQLEAIIAFDPNTLLSGINIFTLFDDHNTPLLERLYFNYNGIFSGKIAKETITKRPDSITIRLQLKDYEEGSYSNLSVSVLPDKTKSYNHHNNIFSSVYLQPYLKGAIENGAYYFENVTNKTKYDLDLLLLSQGWSSYNWKHIFNGAPLFKHLFEQGIDVAVSVNNTKNGGTYVVYPTVNNNAKIIELAPNNPQFFVNNLVPLEGESFKTSLIVSNGKSKNPGLFVTFQPFRLPVLKQSTNILSAPISKHQRLDLAKIDPLSWDEGVVLDEVVIKHKVKSTRIEALQRKNFNGRINILSPTERMTNPRLSIYLNKIGWVSEEFEGTFTLTNPRIRWGPNVPLVFLDDAMISDLSVLQTINMSVVDYIVSDLFSNGGMGIRGSAGYIKIYTDPALMLDSTNKASEMFIQLFPVSFAQEQRFYTPIYKNYNTPFFNEFGVMGWVPNLQFNSQGYVELKVPNNGVKNFNLHIEGVINEHQLISTIKKIALD